MSIIDGEHLFSIEDTDTGKLYFLFGVTSGKYSSTTTLSTYTTIQGTTMTDHAYAEPITIEISTTLSYLNKTSKCVHELSTGKDVVYGPDEFKKLVLDWKHRAVRLNIQLRNFFCRSMCITSLANEESDENRGTINMSIGLTEARIGYIKTISLDIPYIPPADQDNPAVDNNGASLPNVDSGSWASLWTSDGFLGSYTSNTTFLGENLKYAGSWLQQNGVVVCGSVLKIAGNTENITVGAILRVGSWIFDKLHDLTYQIK